MGVQFPVGSDLANTAQMQLKCLREAKSDRNEGFVMH